jgi:hypothetical protein
VTDWLRAKFGRMRVSTLVLIVAFIALFWVHQAFQPEPTATQAPPTAVVPPGFVPDPDYTWVPRTNVREQPRITTTTTTPPTTTFTTPPTTTPPTTPPTTTGQPPPPDEEPGDKILIGGHDVRLVKIKGNGDSLEVEVDGQVWTVEPGAMFAENFKLVRIDGKCAKFLFGDQSFELCEKG